MGTTVRSRGRSTEDYLERAYNNGRTGKDLPSSWRHRPDFDALTDAYEAGVADADAELEAAPAVTEPAPVTTPASTPRRSSSPAKRTSTRRRRRSYTRTAGRRARQARAKARTVGRAAKLVTPGAASRITTGSQFVLATFAVTALYLVLTNAAPFSGFIGGAGKALDWLIRPDRSIPYRPH